MNMKTCILTAMALIPIIGMAQNNAYRLTIRLSHPAPGAKAYLVREYGMTDQKTLDSAGLQHGLFTFHGPVGSQPSKAMIVIGHAGGLDKYSREADARVVWLVNGDTHYKGADSIRTAMVTGSQINIDEASYEAEVLSIDRKAEDSLNAAFRDAGDARRKDPVFRGVLTDYFNSIVRQRDSMTLVWIGHHPES